MILLGENQEMIAEMLDYQGSSLINSIMQACTKGYMAAIEKMYLHDKGLFQKTYIGTSALEVAIWQNNNELVSYIAENDPKVIEGRTCKGESYFHLALRYECHEIIQIISKNIDLKEECLSLCQNNNHKVFEEIIKHDLLSQNELKEIFNLSIKNYRSDFAQVCLKAIKDVSALLTESIIKQDLAVTEYLTDMPDLKSLFISDQIDNGVQNIGDSVQDIID